MKRLFFMLGAALSLCGLQAIEIQGHRGFRSLFPENTLPGFAAAIEAGIPTLELDLQVTRDGEVVIYHDFFLNENFLVTKTPICQLSLEEVKQFDCGSKIDSEFPDQKQIPNTKIPTLDELFTLLETLPHPNAKTVRLNLEIKRDPRNPKFTEKAESLTKKIVLKVQERGFTQRVYYSSFDPKVLSEIRNLDKNAVLGLIFEEQGLAYLEKITFKDPIETIIKVAKSVSATILSPHYTILTDPNKVRAWQEAGFQVIPWTVNSLSDWKNCIEMGVDGVITDYPKQLLETLD